MNAKHAGGRPTNYNPTFVDEIQNYIASTGREQTKLPTLEGVALWLGISYDALEDYRVKYPEFSGALAKISLLQKEQLINDGIYGGKEVNSTIVKLLLQNNHGMKERNDVTSNDDKIEPIQVIIKDYGAGNNPSAKATRSDTGK